ncbi:protein kinase domain-containing protein [Streptomyces stelliscabiei]|uniref:non-specific serine/threonine protein kinase n=1 Tax=Streptomyces stelliscabiei TaxID=146820 RepID=A0A8I0PBD7_9ACTN|nr:protein kinase [Streptomyces stelliscabiei]KND44071.1 serine/threonine protein kinase [Streptomyces stelliscabiei]MBE1598608.1 serine/threonine protein kinase [Streptomyces stelliscabiei]MDX2516599.1 protein kinase [Streptomyces stelliscabiei]
MAQQQRSQGPSDPEATGGGMSDAPELWGNGGLVGDGRYRMTHRLGRGGMAEVFAAEDVRLGRTVAVKLLRSDLAEDPISKARFTREAQAVAGLNHHSIVAVYDSGEDVVNGTPVPYIVMELVEGRTIRDLLINAEAPGPEQALIIVSGVLEALAYSHQHGIVHRDIKPANVIITDNGAVKVMDFGIARALHGASTTMTQTGMVMGTPQYLSPEQALGKAVDHRSDLYATGCLLYELLALRPPFIGETPLSVVYQHVQDIPVPPSQSSEGAAPPELDGLVMRSLAKEPDDRFQTAEEMRGLVQYGLQMLYDQGGHTGTWNTGPVAVHDGRQTPPGGMSGTTVMPHPGEPGTSQIPQPILPGYGGGGRDDGGFEGRGNRGSGRGKLWILAVLAVIAITAGVALALNTKKDGGSGGTETTKSPTTSTSSKDKDPTETPSDDVTEEETEDSNGTGDQPDYTPSYTRSPSFSQSPTPSQPTAKPTTEDPPTEEPTVSEEPEPPVSESPDDGTSGDTAGLPGGVGGGDDEE